MQVAIASFQSQYAGAWNYIMAASTIVALPMLVLFVIFQRQIIEFDQDQRPEIAACPSKEMPMTQAGLSPLRGLPKLREAKTRRFSSYDRTGGNDDRLHIEPGRTVTIAEYEGAGIVTHIWATLACKSELFLRKIVLRAWWDGEEHPSVETPIGDFFGMGHAQTRNFASLPVQASPEDGKAFNCYFPMPFETGHEVYGHKRGRGRPALLLLRRPRTAR